MPLIRDITNSYTLFRHNHSGIKLSGLRLLTEDGKVVGYIENQFATPQHTFLDGWADAEKVTVYNRDGLVLASAVPHIPRPDVQHTLGATHDRFGFTLNIPERHGRLRLTVTRHGHESDIPLLSPSVGELTLNELRLHRRYLAAIAGAAPDVWRWMKRRDEEARRRAGRVFRGAHELPPFVDYNALKPSDWPERTAEPITIVMPVYGGLDLLNHVIRRVNDHTDLPWHLIVVNDASPDPEIEHCLLNWQNRLTKERMTVLTATQNLGFVGAANLGLDAAISRGHDVVLLNSDAMVPAGWSSRLLHPMRSMNRVASVTPLSNDGEIANVPHTGKRIALRKGEALAIDICAKRLDGPEAIADVPTGVGFCMAMNIDMLRRNPRFDSTFGRGYGEEVDWCQKADRLGWRNLLTAGLFVEHLGGQTFGSDAKQRLIHKNGKIISNRYPRFDQRVDTFMKLDPLRTQRIKLGLVLAIQRAKGQGKKLGVYLGHGLGGGAEVYLAQRIAADLVDMGFAAVIRTMPNQSWQFELHSELGITTLVADDVYELMPLFEDTSGLHLVYSCGVGTAKPLDIPDLLLRLLFQPGSTLEVTFNDYFPISPSYTLLDSTGAFGPIPPDPSDPNHQFTGPDNETITLEEWQETWGELIARASELTTFSANSAEIVAKSWPEHADKIVLRPHRLPQSVPRIAPVNAKRETVIGVLGNISVAKGGAVLTELSQELARNGKGRIVLIGNLEPGYRLAPPSLATGSYRMIQLKQLAEKHGITRWFFPSIWPETFSYVTHEVIATGLPVWSFDIGAQGDAVREALLSGSEGGLLPLVNGQYDVKSIADVLTAA